MRVTVNVPDAVGADAEEAAREEEMSVSALFAEAVEAYLKERRRDRAIRRIDAVIGSLEDANEIERDIARDRANSDRRVH